MIPARRGVVIELGEPWGDVTVERSMTALKFYHDFNCEVEHYSYAFGPCWEPVIAQCNLSKFMNENRSNTGIQVGLHCKCVALRRDVCR
jgi:hypothetical protein